MVSKKFQEASGRSEIDPTDLGSIGRLIKASRDLVKAFRSMKEAQDDLDVAKKDETHFLDNFMGDYTYLVNTTTDLFYDSIIPVLDAARAMNAKFDKQKEVIDVEATK